MVTEDKIITVENKPLETLQSDVLIRVRDCAKTWAKGTGPVERCDIRPDDMPLSLKHISLVERLNSGPKLFHIILTGEEITNRTLGYVAGNFIEDVTPSYYSKAMIKYYGEAIDYGQQIAQNITWDYDHRFLRIERFMVPLIMKDQPGPSGLLIATVRNEDTLTYMARKRHFAPSGAE